jgi:hypothetical protein
VDRVVPENVGCHLFAARHNFAMIAFEEHRQHRRSFADSEETERLYSIRCSLAIIAGLSLSAWALVGYAIYEML